MTIGATPRKRDKLAAQLTWLANRDILNLPEDRRHDRIVPRNPIAVLTLEDGTKMTCRIIDLSLSGAAIAAENRPPLKSIVLLGRGWAVDKVDIVAASIDDGLAKVPPLLDRADDGVTRVQERITIVGDAATAVSAAANEPPEIVQRFSAALTGVSERYIPLRESYADARARIVSVSDRLETLDRLLPGMSLPQGPSDTLVALDTKVQALDDKIMGLLTVNERASRVGEAADAVNAKTTEVVGSLDEVKVGIGNLEVRLEETRTKVASTADSVRLAITIGTLIVLLLLAYLAALHVVLYRWAGGRNPMAPKTPSA